MPSVIKLIEQDHREVEELFSQFEQSGDKNIAMKICQELDAHTDAEEKAFYPVVRADGRFFNMLGEGYHVAFWKPPVARLTQRSVSHCGPCAQVGAIAYQDAPQTILPPELKDDNPLKILRRINGALTRDAIAPISGAAR